MILFLLYIYWTAFILFLAWGQFATRKISHFLYLSAEQRMWPSVSIVVPARNEGKKVLVSLESLVSLQYPSLEIIVINDRSEDDTGLIMDRFAVDHPSIRVVHIEDLPDQWLGKNHALHRGLHISTGKYVIFSDADIKFSSEILKAAVAYAENNELDHLPLLISVEGGSFWLRSLELVFFIQIFAFMQPWLYSSRWPFSVVGVGAFNLVNRATLLSLGGFEQIRLRPDEDWKLGRLMKINGCRVDCLDATSHISVEWYKDLPEALRAFEKNLFAAFNYNVLSVFVGITGLIVTYFLPYMAPMVGGIQIWIFPVSYFFLALWISKFRSEWRVAAFILPLGSLIFCYALIRTTFLNLARGGLFWRGTFYSLKDLKK